MQMHLLDSKVLAETPCINKFISTSPVERMCVAIGATFRGNLRAKTK
jgi:hypothetical protein